MIKLSRQSALKKWVALPIIAGTLLWGPQPSYASKLNPYSHVETLDISGQEEAAYIQQKTTQIFSASAASRSEADGYEVPQGWKQEKLIFHDVPVEKYTFSKTKTDRSVLFFHGGGYVGGLHSRYRDWGIHLAELAGNATLLAVDYRLAPQHVYPAALDDAVTAYKGLLASGYDPERMVMIGDSAGGNLAAALALYLRDHSLPQPKAMILISPWTHMENNLPSRKNNLQKDQILGVKNVRMGSEIVTPSYAQGAVLTEPYLSPSYADLTGLAPMLITAGGDELFLDDTALFASHAEAAGVSVQYTIYPGMSHDWTILLPELPESEAMEKEIAQFTHRTLGRG